MKQIFFGSIHMKHPKAKGIKVEGKLANTILSPSIQLVIAAPNISLQNMDHFVLYALKIISLWVEEKSSNLLRILLPRGQLPWFLRTGSWIGWDAEDHMFKCQVICWKRLHKQKNSLKDLNFFQVWIIKLQCPFIEFQYSVNLGYSLTDQNIYPLSKILW